MKQAKHQLACPMLAVLQQKGVIKTMTTISILVQKVVDTYLRKARQLLEQDGFLQPTLFLHIAGDDILVMPLMLPESITNEAIYFLSLGYALSQRGLQPSEAILLSKSWFVPEWEASAVMKVSASEHPARQEALVAIGRRADNRRYTQVVQPFTRNRANRPVWQPMPLAMYDEQRTMQDGPSGILDFLFEGMPVSA